MHPRSLTGGQPGCSANLTDFWTLRLRLTKCLLAGTFVDGEGLEKGGRRKLEPGKSVVTIGRCEMTIRLLRKQLAKGQDRRGDCCYIHVWICDTSNSCAPGPTLIKPAHRVSAIFMSLQGGRHPMVKRSSHMLAELHTLTTELLSKAESLVMSMSRSSIRTMTTSPTVWALVSRPLHSWHLGSENSVHCIDLLLAFLLFPLQCWRSYHILQRCSEQSLAHIKIASRSSSGSLG